MRPCNPPHISALLEFRNIGRGKRAPRCTRLRSLRPNIRVAYLAFAANRSDLTRLIPLVFADSEKEDLLHCYDPAGKRLNGLKATISTAQADATRSKCPYCWIDSPRTFDHYLPKERFPEFAVHGLNLLPACFTCNGKKGVKYRENGQKTFLYLYLDALPPGRYLSVSVSFVDGVPKAEFGIVRPGTFSNAQFQLLRSHFKELDLLQRYSEHAADVFSDAERLARAHVKIPTEAQISKFFSDEARSLATEIHPNFWRAILYEALAADRVFIQRCLA